MTRASRFLGLVAILALLFPLGAPVAQSAPTVPVSSNVGCDPIDPQACLLPFPNDFFTVADDSTDTGRRVNFNIAAMPRTGAEITEGGEGKPMDPTEWNRNDGFSPGSMVMTYVPDVDLHATWGTQDRPHSDVGINEAGYFDYRDHIADIGLYQQPDAPMVIINTKTGERHPFWSELDLHEGAEGERVLILRPAVNFDEGTRYVVALRNLKRTDGSVIETPASFAEYSGGTGADAGRQTHYDENIFPLLEDAGLDRESLYLAWDFTIASERNLSERMLHMRNDAFTRILGDPNLEDRLVEGAAPEFTVASGSTERTDTWTDSSGVRRSQQVRRIEGTVTVPNYMDRIQQTEGHLGTSHLPMDLPAPNSRLLDLNLDGLPDQNPVEPTVNVPFMCDVPLNGQANNMTLYGHGLLGTRDQVGDIKSPRRAGPFAGCAVDWWGMSTPDAASVATMLTDMSNFPSLPDRAQQGFLNFMFLGRAAVHPEGFATHPEFQQGDGPLVKTADNTGTPLFYDGNSQGGIMGGALVAVSPDISRGILGVPGMNYSTLLNRSVDWEGDLALEPDLPPYSVPFYESYRDPVERQIAFSLIQMLWDRGEANGYAHHMTSDPLPKTPPHDIMLQVAFSDHQVTNHAAEVEARTIGAPIMVPGLPENRHWEMTPYYTPTSSYPYKGSSLVYWDSGNATPPNGNIPPDHGSDPHSHPRNEPAAAWQEAQFLLTGWNVDVCNGNPYLTLRHPANNGTPSCREPAWAPGSQNHDPLPTTISFTNNNDTSGQYSDQATFEAALENHSGAGVAGAEVVFELANADGARAVSATTNDQGIARFTGVLTDKPGSYSLTASFAGSDGAQSSLASMNFVVEREDAALVLTSRGTKQNPSIDARLSDADSGSPVAARRVSISADNNVLGEGLTDGNGVFSVAVPKRYKKDTVFRGSYAGDDFYLPASDQLRN